jgi:hypothetical protein
MKTDWTLPVETDPAGSSIAGQIVGRFHAEVGRWLERAVDARLDLAVSEFELGDGPTVEAKIMMLAPGQPVPRGRRWTAYHTSLPSARAQLDRIRGLF